MRLDETAILILQALQRNARASASELAQACGKSESAVRERLTSLQLAGTLRGYDVRLDWTALGLPLVAVVRARCDLRQVDQVMRRLEALPNVTHALLLTGPKPVEVGFRVRDVQQLDAIMQGHLVGLLQDLEVEVALQALVEPRSPTIPGALGLAESPASKVAQAPLLRDGHPRPAPRPHEPGQP